MSSASDLQTLITNLLDMSYIESGEVSINEVTCSLPDILWDLEAFVRAEAAARQLKLSVNMENLVHENVICDRQQMYQALINIVGNALKFTPPGGHISIGLTESRGAPSGHGFYIFRIRDTGIGMDKEFLTRIFEPFERERTATISGNQGMGLGMAITQNIVEAMGGTISVESEEGKGTEFSISIQFSLA